MHAPEVFVTACRCLFPPALTHEGGGQTSRNELRLGCPLWGVFWPLQVWGWKLRMRSAFAIQFELVIFLMPEYLKKAKLFCFVLIFVLRKKRKQDEEENERGRDWDRERRLQASNPRSLFFLSFCRTWTKRCPITSQMRVKRVCRIHHGWCMGIRMVPWCIRLTRLTLVCEVIEYRLVKSNTISKKNHSKSTNAIIIEFGTFLILRVV